MGALVDALADVRAARAAALLGGRPSDVLAAARTTVTVVGALADRLGIDDAEIARSLADAEALARAVADAVRQHPEIAAPLSAALRAREQPDAADALARLAAAHTPPQTPAHALSEVLA
ncbi:hypothetical protein [Sanguibacter sp. HDW7]|uniref:hypothetical protein n=1 Tax=Sanguibacter sp. HDW7 TaxID=2714931 RepID=UPI00140C6EEE|nr:hypothetical protein [Sanguibacter sp. HDW7]QIK83172.1 hypothetical protein G7063_05655 [Sanguibacter sp. HDW7]